MRRKFVIWCSLVVAVFAAILGVLYARAIPGLSSARTEPPAAETLLATWLLHQSVPSGASTSVNPAPDPSDVAAGKELFRDKCETCHGYDGSGKTPIGSNEFPRVPTLRSAAIAATSDGELFYHIRNGIRNTGMPAWDLPDPKIWQLVAFIRNLPKVAPMTPAAAAPIASPPTERTFRGIGRVQELSRERLCTLEPDADGECGARSQANFPTRSCRISRNPIRC